MLIDKTVAVALRAVGDLSCLCRFLSVVIEHRCGTAYNIHDLAVGLMLVVPDNGSLFKPYAHYLAKLVIEGPYGNRSFAALKIVFDFFFDAFSEHDKNGGCPA